MRPPHAPIGPLQGRRLLLACCTVVLLSACGSEEGTPPDAGPTPPDGAIDATLVSLDLLPDEIAAAIADAAERSGAPEAEIAVAGALQVTWADGSLGCPEPDTMYTQALVAGYQLTLEIAGERVVYHGADGEPPFLCAR